ncbi:MAG: 1-deoxy-D-xylulose-5-phosphate synthase [Spirochaetota bacterium]|nr:1-deoxy-D-xylulose-5-phosphate synthase [Spirochaetota bacterium]
MILDSIKEISDLRKLAINEISELADELRKEIIEVISINGGHLASSLGVVELTLALHYVFNTPKDKIIWDVGHQCYAHKILTGRRSEFETIRRFGGLSGFPRMSESEYDVYNSGHSSTSLSLALGEAVARDINNEKYKVVGVVGDGSLTGGMAFEALNQIGHLKKDVIIVLNDNEHFISENVGALSEYLMRLITGSLYNRLRKRSYDIIKKLPKFGNSLYDFLFKMEEGVKGIIMPGVFFEELDIRYFGPVDGHNLKALINILNRLNQINSGPRILHVITRKGKGYKPAEKDPDIFHGIGPFDKKTGLPANNNLTTYSEIVGKTLARISKFDKKVIAITAAMKLGTGLNHFSEKAPERFFDVGIAEQHAITFACALAAKGLKPFVSIYSTFLQRAVDQIIHDVGIMNLPVRILIDRAGIVGEDGETHHGLFDVCIIKNIPNFIFLAPSNCSELRDMLYFAQRYDKGPIAIRYPRGGEILNEFNYNEFNRYEPGKSKRITHGTDIAIFSLGDMMKIAVDLHKHLEKEGVMSSVIDLLSIKPLDLNSIQSVIKNTSCFITMENGYISGGVGESILSEIDADLKDKFLFNVGFPDEFVTHGTRGDLFMKYGLDAESLCKKIIEKMKWINPDGKGEKIRRLSVRKRA